jgi:SAM-dependent methyltransferase
LSELVDGYDVGEYTRTAAAEAQSFWARRRQELIVWALRRYFPAAESFFEIGCGTGIVLAAIREALPELRVTGGDAYRPALETAHGQLEGVELMQVDALRVPFLEEFDVVGLFDVLEHVEDDEAVLREAHCSIRPGGGLIVTVPQHPRLWSAADEWALHRRRYTRSDLLSKLRHAGFDVERATSFFSFLLPGLALMRIIPTSRRGYDSCREFRIVKRIEPLLNAVMAVELAGIRRGLPLRAGGSLLVVARRPVRPAYAVGRQARIRTRSGPVGDRDQHRRAGVRLP